MRLRPGAVAGFCIGGNFAVAHAAEQNSKATIYKSSNYRGVTYPAFAEEKVMQTVIDDLRRRHTLGSGDIVIATYPKCGTTWMQQIVLTLLAGGDGSKVRDPMAMSPWGELLCCVGRMTTDEFIDFQSPPSTQSISPTRRVLKTHAPAQLAPWTGTADEATAGIQAGARVIVVTRNPKDAAVSLFHHTKDGKSFEFKGGWAEFLHKLFLPGIVESGCYWEWTASWWKVHQAHEDRVMWISYEELKQDLPGSIAKVAKFCNIEATPGQIQTTVEASTFSSMKKVTAEEDAKKLASGKQVKKNHIRQGLKGAWTKVFTVNDVDVFNEHHAKKCEEFSLPTELFSF